MVLKTSTRKEWENLVNYCKQHETLAEECEWALQQIEHAVRS